MNLVLDAWPLTTLLAGTFAAVVPGRAAAELRALCKTRGGVQFEERHVEALRRYLETATGVWTTGPVLGEAFHHLERATGEQFEAFLTQLHERFPGPALFVQTWEHCVDPAIAGRFGVGDASVVDAARRLPAGRLMVEDWRLHGWCVRNGVPVVTCMSIADVFDLGDFGR